MHDKNELLEAIKVLEREKEGMMKEMSSNVSKLRSNEITLDAYKEEEHRLNVALDRVLKELFPLRSMVAQEKR